MSTHQDLNSSSFNKLRVYGQELARDTVYAYARWWSVAVAKGYDDARDHRDNLSQEMTGEQTATA